MIGPTLYENDYECRVEYGEWILQKMYNQEHFFGNDLIFGRSYIYKYMIIKITKWLQENQNFLRTNNFQVS